MYCFLKGDPSRQHSLREDVDALQTAEHPSEGWPGIIIIPISQKGEFLKQDELPVQSHIDSFASIITEFTLACSFYRALGCHTSFKMM